MQDYEIWPQETTNIDLSCGVEILTDYLSGCTQTDGQTAINSKHGKKIVLRTGAPLNWGAQCQGITGIVVNPAVCIIYVSTHKRYTQIKYLHCVTSADVS